MRLGEIPAGCVPVQCRRCYGYLALPQDTASAELLREMMVDHGQLCPGPPPNCATLPCTYGGPRHCECAADTGWCCWCGAETASA